MEITTEKNNLGVKHFLNNDFETAEKYYKEAIGKDKSNATAFNNLGLLYHQKKDYKIAREYFEKAIEIAPKDTYYLNLANSLVYLNQFPEAESNYQKCLELNPDSKNAKVSLARFYEVAKRANLATQLWEELAKISNEDFFKIELSKNYMALGDFENALLMLSYITATNNTHVAWKYIGICEFNLKNYGLAERAFKKCLATEPNNYKARHYLALNYLSKGMYEEAMTALDFLMKMHPDNIKVQLDKAAILLNLQKYKEALEIVEIVLNVQSDNKKAQYYKKVVEELMKKSTRKTTP